LTAQPAIEIPDRPTAKTIITTAAAWLQPTKPVAIRQIAGPMNPTNRQASMISRDVKDLALDVVALLNLSSRRSR